METVWLEEASSRLVTGLFRLYRGDPFTHFYAVYDLVYHPDATTGVLLAGMKAPL